MKSPDIKADLYVSIVPIYNEISIEIISKGKSL